LSVVGRRRRRRRFAKEGLCFTLLRGAFGEEVVKGFFVDGERDKVFEALE
jgi:hypothetical protein